ncbi:MAG: phosphodiester glycosidase family protein [Candidatus Sericytochromatia bacterium]
MKHGLSIMWKAAARATRWLGITLVAWSAFAPIAQAKPVKLERRSLGGVPAQVVTVDLSDANTCLDILLANNAPRANSSQEQFGDEAFGSMVKRAKAATVVNGTFFSKDAQKRVMGNMVRGGTFVKYSRWENFGTSFGLDAGNRPDMFTIRDGDVPRWEQHWFSITAGPRLLKQGSHAIDPAKEGFRDPHVLNAAARAALGYSRDGKTLWLVSFLAPLSLTREAEAMKALGAWQAMNLDGGASKAMAYKSSIVLAPSRRITNAIAVYDSGSPAAQTLKQSRTRFQSAMLPNGDSPILSPDAPIAQPTPVPTPVATPAVTIPTQPTPTPTPVIIAAPTPTPQTDVMSHPQAMAALAAPKYFFWYLHIKDYPKAWGMLTEHSRKAIVREIKLTMDDPDWSEERIRQGLDDYDPSFAPAFWDAFRYTIDSEKWIKSFYVLDRVDESDGLVLVRPHNIQLKVIHEHGGWRFDFAESFM